MYLDVDWLVTRASPGGIHYTIPYNALVYPEDVGRATGVIVCVGGVSVVRWGSGTFQVVWMRSFHVCSLDVFVTSRKDCIE